MFAAVDIGGTKTLVAVFDKHGSIIERQKFATPVDYEEFKIELTNTVAKLSTKDFQRVVVAAPARLDRKHGVALAFGNLTWTNIPIGKDAETIFMCPMLLENDAKLAALSEAILLKGEFRKVLYVTISTGINAGLIIDGKIELDFEDMEAGQLLLEYRGRLMDWEDFGSGRAFQKKFGKRVSDTPADDVDAWYWFARNIAIGLVDLAATLTPEVIIIGGGAGAHLEKFQSRLEEELKIYENPMFAIPQLRKAQRAEDAVIYGCYELGKQHHEKLTFTH
jgi:predicted NBD/HSP70 family sugar kinase